MNDMKPVGIVRTVHTIDATGMSVGRVATRVVTVLCGKHKATFNPRIDGGDMVKVVNVSKVKFTGKKLVQKDFRHHTMYPGGLKRIPMKRVFGDRPEDVLRHAVNGMLPKNRRRTTLLKRLTIVA